MANILYLGATPLIDLSGYASTSYVDAAVQNVDVTQQLGDYLTIANASIGFVAKESGKVLSSNDFTDALKTKLEGLSNFDPTDISTALSTIQSTLADITDDSSAAVQSTIDTWNEIKTFLSDFDTTDSLSSIISATSSQIQTWVGQQGYLKSNDISTFITDNDASVYALKSEVPTVPTTVSSFTNDAGYQTANDVSTFITAADVPTVPTTVSSFTNDANYQTASDVSTKVASANQSVMNIVSISAADYTALATKDASTLYIVL